MSLPLSVVPPSPSPSPSSSSPSPFPPLKRRRLEEEGLGGEVGVVEEVQVGGEGRVGLTEGGGVDPSVESSESPHQLPPLPLLSSIEAALPPFLVGAQGPSHSTPLPLHLLSPLPADRSVSCPVLSCPVLSCPLVSCCVVLSGAVVVRRVLSRWPPSAVVAALQRSKAALTGVDCAMELLHLISALGGTSSAETQQRLSQRLLHTLLHKTQTTDHNTSHTTTQHNTTPQDTPQDSAGR